MKKLSVLVVDDHLANLEVAKVILETEGHAVTTCLDGAEAVARVVEHGQRYDLILMDVNMPVMDGLEATRRLRAHGGTADTAIIIVTGSTGLDDEAKGLAVGADRFFRKPYKRQELLGVIENTLAARRA